jgi:Uma2 family endonuclease
MATATEAPAAIQAETEPPDTIYRLTVDEYERIGEFLDNSRVELLDGLLVKKMTKNPPHVVSCARAGDALSHFKGWYPRSQDPIRLPPSNEPEPDVALVRGKRDDYRDHHPGAADVALVVEVADTTLEKDRRKAFVYAASGIPVYWLVNLVARRVEVYTGPGADGYLSRVDRKPGEQLDVIIDGKTVGQIAVDDLLP